MWLFFNGKRKNNPLFFKNYRTHKKLKLSDVADLLFQKSRIFWKSGILQESKILQKICIPAIKIPEQCQ